MTALDPKARPACAPRVRLQTDLVTGDPVLLYPEGLLVLNDAAHAVVSRCDGATTIEGIIESLAEEYEVEGEQLRTDVMECLADLCARNLIVLTP